MFLEVGHDKEHDPFIIKEAWAGPGPKIVDWPQTSPLLVYDYMICIRIYIYIYIYIHIYICDIWYSYPTYLVCLWKLGIYSKNIRMSLQGKWCFKPFWVEWGTIFSGTEPTWLRVSNSLNNLCLHAWMMSLFNWCEGWVEVNQIILEYIWMHVHIYIYIICFFLAVWSDFIWAHPHLQMVVGQNYSISESQNGSIGTPILTYLDP